LIHSLAVRHTCAEFLGTLEARFEARWIVFISLRPMTGQDLVAASRGDFAQSPD
jgi:hypothetical protein